MREKSEKKKTVDRGNKQNKVELKIKKKHIGSKL